MRQAIGVTAVADKYAEQGFQCGFVLLAGQLMNRQLVSSFIVLGVLCQPGFQQGRFRQLSHLAQEGQLGTGAGQRLLVFITFDRIEQRFCFTQFAALGQSAGIQNQGGCMLVVLAENAFEQYFGLRQATAAE